jgi:two-component system, OmpR family, alkaline phosphatase synthesis response regulator PhoP
MTKCILLCDDEIQILRAAEFKLKRAGYDVILACDGEEAWEVIQRRVPDLLITDCQMPRLDGLGLVRRLRENPPTANLPIFMLTAKGLELRPAELAARWGVRGLISKPFSPRELLQTVDELLKPEGSDQLSVVSCQ